MVGNINIPKDLGKTVIVEVKDNSTPLRNFLTDLLMRIEKLEEQVKVLNDA